jgi:hypothetical protein
LKSIVSFSWLKPNKEEVKHNTINSFFIEVVFLFKSKINL